MRAVLTAVAPAAGLAFQRGRPARHPAVGPAGFGPCGVDSGQKLSHYRGQIEPPASLPRGATVGCFGEVLSEEWRKRQEPESAIAARLRLTLPLTSWAACRPRLAPPGELG